MCAPFFRWTTRWCRRLLRPTECISKLSSRQRNKPLSPACTDAISRSVKQAPSPQVAHYLCLTAIHQQARTLVEFGTSHGYSTLHLAAAAQRTGGRVFSLDRVPEKTKAAQANLRQAGLDHLVECYTGEGDAFIAALPERVDFVFVDFGLPAFAPMFTMLESRLVSGAFLFVDGWSKVEQWDQNPEWAAFRSRLDETADWLTYILPLEKSHLIAVKLA